jgi:hypothetical protein
MRLAHISPRLVRRALAYAQQLEVIYCEIPSSPKSSFPARWTRPAACRSDQFKALEDCFVSPDGSTWMVKARTQQGSDEENILIFGPGTSGTMFAQEGQPVHGGASGELYDFFGSSGRRFNSLNQFAYSARARGGVVGSVPEGDRVGRRRASTSRPQMGDLYTA